MPISTDTAIGLAIGVLALVYFSLALIKPSLICRFYQFWVGNSVRYSEKQIRIGAIAFMVVAILIMLLVPRR